MRKEPIEKRLKPQKGGNHQYEISEQAVRNGVQGACGRIDRWRNFVHCKEGQGVRTCVNACVFVNLMVFSSLVKMDAKSAVESKRMR